MQYNSWLYLFPFLGGSIILFYLIVNSYFVRNFPTTGVGDFLKYKNFT